VTAPRTARPLQGRRLIVTRQADQAGELAARLRVLGAEVEEVPTLEVVPPVDTRSLDQALSRLTDFHFMAFTSANAVEAVSRRLLALGHELPASLRLASVGAATTAALASAFPGRSPDLEPAADFRAAGLVDAFRRRGVAGERGLLPQSELARDELASGLAALGAEVEAVTAYRILEPPGLPERVKGALARPIDAVLFASPSAVNAFRAALGPHLPPPPAVVIGPTTQAAAAAAGFTVLAVAGHSTTDGLVEALREALN
jgi:uroporphyrinogen-III synthase